MAYPDEYDRQFDYQSYQNSNPTRPLPGDKLNADLNAVSESTQEIIDFIKTSIRDDGAIMNGAVGYDQLAPSIQANGLAPVSNWAAGTFYGNNWVVIQNGNLYRATSAHTSTTFSVDLAAGLWTFMATLPGGDKTDAGNLTSGTLPVGREQPGVAIFDTNTVELWLATGQSNMVRQPAYPWSPPSNAKIWNLTLATDGSVGTAFVALPTTTITFPSAFIADRANRFPNKTIYLLNVGKDSNPISQWLPGASSTPPLMDVYANIQANITAALAAAGVTKITGVLWWQGETDCANSSTTWRTDFETVVTRFQTNSWCPATIPWVICGIGGRNNNAPVGLNGDLFNNQYILPAVNASPQYRRYLDTSAWPYISATGVQYWETVTPGHFLGQGNFEAGGIASKSFYHDVGALVLRSQRQLNWAAIGMVDSPVTWNFNTAASVAPLNVGGSVRTYVHLVAEDGIGPVVSYDSFGILGTTITARHADNTLTSKSAVASGRTTMQIGPQTWDGSAFNTNARISFKTVNLQSGSDHSSKIAFATTPTGSTTVADQAWLESDGSFSVGEDVSAGIGIVNALNGFKVAHAAASGNVLRGDGTKFVGAQLALSDLPVLTGYVSGAGTVAATDSILSAIQKLNGNDALALPKTGGTLSGAIAMGTNAITGLTTLAAAGALTFQSNGSTFAGDITTGQQWFIGGTLNAPPTGPLITVSKNVSALPAIGTPLGVVGTAQDVAHFGGVDGNPAELFIQSFGSAAGAGAAGIRYFQASGTAAAPTATVAGTMGANFFYGYTGSVYVAGAGFIATSTQTFSGSVSGTRLDLYATPTGSTGVAIGAAVGAGFMVGDTVDPGAGGITATGLIKSKSATAGIGYATGAGGTITQATSRTTGVTLNTVTGAITLVNAAGSASFQSFTLTNSAIAATDIIKINQKSGTDKYQIFVTNIAAGSCQISFATTGGTTTEQPVFNFAIIKGVTS